MNFFFTIELTSNNFHSSSTSSLQPSAFLCFQTITNHKITYHKKQFFFLWKDKSQDHVIFTPHAPAFPSPPTTGATRLLLLAIIHSSTAKLMNKLVDSFNHDDTPDVGCVRAVLAELVLTFLFVFTGVSAAMAAGTYLSVHPPRAVESGRLLSLRSSISFYF